MSSEASINMQQNFNSKKSPKSWPSLHIQFHGFCIIASELLMKSSAQLLMHFRDSGWWLARVLLTSQHTAVDFLLSVSPRQVPWLTLPSQRSQRRAPPMSDWAAGCASSELWRSHVEHQLTDAMESASAFTLYDEANTNPMKVCDS